MGADGKQVPWISMGVANGRGRTAIRQDFPFPVYSFFRMGQTEKAGLRVPMAAQPENRNPGGSAMPENRKRRPGEKSRQPSAADYSRDVFLTNPIASANECTGLTQTVPQTQEEAESYCDLADVPVTARDGSGASHRPK